MNEATEGLKQSFLFKHGSLVLFIFLITLVGGSTLAVELTLGAMEQDDSMETLEPYRYLKIREHSPSYSNVFGQNPEQFLEADGLAVRDVPFTTDENSYIVPSKVHDNADLNIYFFGGSTTECLQVLPEKRFPYVAGRLIEDGLSVTTNSYNVGVGGQHTMLSNINLVAKGARNNADIAVLMHVWNDISMFLLRGDYWTQTPRGVYAYKEQQGEGLVHYVKSVAKVVVPNIYTQLVKLKAALGTPSNTPTGAGDEFAGQRQQVDMSKWQDFLGQFESSIRMFVSTSRAWGIEPVLMTQANRLEFPLPEKLAYSFRNFGQFGLTPPDFKDMYFQATDIIRKVAQEENVTLVDLDREIPKDKEHMYDLMHYTDQGSEFAAKIIAQKLAPLSQEILEQKKRQSQ